MKQEKYRKKIILTAVVIMSLLILQPSSDSEARSKNYRYYRVKRGDTLSQIAKKYRVNISSLARLNGIGNRSKIKAGRVIKVPGKNRYSKRYKRYGRKRRIAQRKENRYYSKIPKIQMGPVLSFPEAGGLHLWWFMSNMNSYHSVEYGTSEKMPYKIELRKSTRFPFVHLQNIVPGMKYFYRVQSGRLKSRILSFKAFKYNPHFRIGIWADNQDGAGIFKNYTVPLLEKYKPTFLLALGDLVQSGSSYDNWYYQLYGPGRRILNAIPLLPVRGNHDGEDLLARCMVPFPEKHWYTFNLGPMCMIVLDSNLDYSPGSEQYKWLKDQLESEKWEKASYRVISLHHPPYTNLFDISNYYEGDSIRKYLVPLFEKYSANIVLSGHAHCYAHGIKDAAEGKIHYFVLGGGGGKLDSVTVAEWPHIVKTVQSHHIAVADVSNDKFEIMIINSLNDTLIDRVVIKGKPIRD